MESHDRVTAPGPARRKIQPVVFLFALALLLALIWRSGRHIFDAGRASGSVPPAATAPVATP